MLDGSKIEMLANLTFSDDRREEARVFRECKLPAVDIWWTRPATTRSTYRGVRDLAINTLARVYDVLQFQDLESRTIGAFTVWGSHYSLLFCIRSDILPMVSDGFTSFGEDLLQFGSADPAILAALL